MMGPIDYVVLGFEGNRFDGSIMKELSKAVNDGTIRVLDLVFIIKDRDGTVMETEYIDQSEELKATFGDFHFEENLPLMTDEDIIKISAGMEEDSAAAILVVEQLWAKDLKQAIADAGGFVIDDGRIHAENVEAAMREIEVNR